MKYFAVKKAMNYFDFNLYHFFSTAPTWLTRPIINTYYGDCWANIPEKCPVLFIHIPKNAGSSIEKIIYGKEFGHTPASFFWVNNKERYNQKTTFAIIRNPYDRFCSIFYHYLNSPRRSTIDDKIGTSFFCKHSTPEKFARHILTNKSAKAYFKSLVIAFPQVDWIMVEGKTVVKNLFPFEKLNKAELFIRRVTGNPKLTLPHINDSKRDKEWEQEIGPATKVIVEELYNNDLKLWQSLL